MDPLLLSIQIVLGALGILGVSAAVPASALEHAGRILGALAVTFVVARIPPKRVVKASPIIYVGVVLLLAAVLVIGISPAGSESKRWLMVGPVALQPSEFMKVAVIAYLTAFFYNHLGNWEIWRPMLVIGLAAGLIIIQPDVSTAAFLFVLAFTIMLAAGTSVVRLIAISTAAGIVAMLIVGTYLSQFDYLQNRLVGFADMHGAQDRTDSVSYQAYVARKALIEAGVTGIGPGVAVRVPEADTDMVAIAVGRSLGLIGMLTLVTLYVLLVGRGLRIAGSLSGPASLMAAGSSAYIGGQAAMNLLVTAGWLPVTGIPLPFVSYGLNSLMSCAIATGFIHAAYRQARAEGADP